MGTHSDRRRSWSPPGANTAGGADGGEPPIVLRDFGEFVDLHLKEVDDSQTRLANLVGVDTSLICRIIHGHSVSETMTLRIMIASLKLSVMQLRFLNRGLGAGGWMAFPIPGETVTSHEEHDRLKRGGVRGKRYGNRATENARAQRGER